MWRPADIARRRQPPALPWRRTVRRNPLTMITATFSEAMDASTITSSSFNVAVIGGSSVTPTSVSYDVGTKTATFTPLPT